MVGAEPVIAPAIVEQPLPYQDRLDSRAPDQITVIVLHCTELPDLAMARQYAETIHYPGTQTGNSGHYYITREGVIEQWVNPQRVAHHVANKNLDSIGVELVNLGRYPDWHALNAKMTEPYPEPQIASLIELINELEQQLPCLQHICGHEDLDDSWVTAADAPSKRVRRKLDPGPLFPWDAVMRCTKLKRAVSL